MLPSWQKLTFIITNFRVPNEMTYRLLVAFQMIAIHIYSLPDPEDLVDYMYSSHLKNY